MKVSNIGASKASAAPRRKKSGKADSTFADQLRQAAAAGHAAEAIDTPPIAASGAVVAVQETPGATDERSRGLTRRHGEDILSRLDEIRHGLLSGSISKERIVDLAQTLRARRQRSDDPQLNQIIDEVELRAEVEIAKLTRDV